MKSFKTIVVILTLLGVGYGAHVVMNKPLPNDLSSVGAEGWDSLSVTMQDPGDSRPEVSFDSQESVTMPSLPVPGNAAPPPANITGQQPGYATDAPAAAAAYTQSSMSVSTQPVQATPNNFADNGTNYPMADYGAAGSGTADYGTADYGTAQAGPSGQHAADPAVDAMPVNFQQQFGSANDSGAAGQNFESMWQTAQRNIQEQDLAQALFTLSFGYEEGLASAEQRQRLIPLLDQLAGTVLYSQQYHVVQPHIVRRGEGVEQLSQQYNVPVAFIERVNQLSTGRPLREGQQLKVLQGPFRAELDLTRRELTLFLNRYYAGRFSVSIGRDLPAGLTSFQVAEKSGPREFYDVGTNRKIPAGHHSNPYGAHWIGLACDQDRNNAKLGIHSAGTAVDANDTRGCISVSNRDADDLMAILSVGSQISVVR
ncbi:MAG: L,D-transpeptidase family protein [Pirellulaceae bacterium]